MADMCNDNRFVLIEKYKQKLIEATNISDRQEEMAVIDSILFRFWQMGWLDKLEQQELILEEEKQKQIQVGDEVRAHYGNAIVTYVNEITKTAGYFYQTGEYGCDYFSALKRTGRHFNEIKTLMEKMREK